MKSLLSSPLLLLLFTCMGCNDREVVAVESAAVESSSPEPEPKESPWGRLYLRNGLAPIQYFRDNFGGPMVSHEVFFYFPKRDDDRLGCELLPEDEQTELRAANHSAALVVDRGECTFEHKARLAEQMGAAALVVVSPSDDVIGPVGGNDDKEIGIASVMIRRTGGDMLRAVASQTTLSGRLIPMTCQRKPFTCKPRTEAEQEYAATFTARSGEVLSVGDKETEGGAHLGNFLAATYGSVLPTSSSFLLATPLDGSQACAAVEDDSYKSKLMGKVVMLPVGKAGGCSEFEKVSNTQRRGASVVLLMERDNATTMTHPSVEVPWHAYNITIPVLAVSSAIGTKLTSLKEIQGEAAALRFTVRNGIAEAWALLAKHSQRSAWPKRQKRCVKTLGKLLGQIRGLGGDSEIEEALKSVFANIVRGSLDDWEKIAHPDEEATASNKESAVATGAAMTRTVDKTQVRDEL